MSWKRNRKRAAGTEELGFEQKQAPELKLKRFDLYFDGGCKPNPGQGYGSYELKAESPCYHQRGLLIQFGFMTNNMAEYQAMLHGVRRLWHDLNEGVLLNWEGTSPLISKQVSLSIWSDSTLLVNQMKGDWKCKNGPIKQLRDEANLILKEFGAVRIHWKGRAANVERFGH